MKTREEVLKFGLSFKNVYEERPFKDQNWQLVRVKESKKAFLWIYEKDGYINYMKGANIAGFMKVAKAMMAQGII